MNPRDVNAESLPIALNIVTRPHAHHKPLFKWWPSNEFSKLNFIKIKMECKKCGEKRCRLIKLAFLESEKRFIKNFFPFF